MAGELSAMTFEAPTWGWISLAASTQGLRMLGLPKRTKQAALHYLQQQYRDAELTPDAPFLMDVSAQVMAYLAGELEQFAVTLDLRGHMSFELAVWAAVARIPFGQTRTYSWVADQVGGGRGAAQAAGAAVGDNPVPLIVPCHPRHRLRRQPARLCRWVGDEGAAAGAGKRPGNARTQRYKLKRSSAWSDSSAVSGISSGSPSSSR